MSQSNVKSQINNQKISIKTKLLKSKQTQAKIQIPQAKQKSNKTKNIQTTLVDPSLVNQSEYLETLVKTPLETVKLQTAVETPTETQMKPVENKSETIELQESVETHVQVQTETVESQVEESVETSTEIQTESVETPVERISRKICRNSNRNN